MHICRMNEPDSSTNPTPDPKKRKSPALLDTRLLKTLGHDEENVRATLDEMAQDAALATDLSTHFIDRENTVAVTPASLQTLLVQIGETRADGVEATSGTAEFHSVTDDQSDDAKKAVAAIRNVQTRAKEKYEETDPARLDAYYLGEPLRSRQQITDAGAAIFILLRTKDDAGQPVPAQDTLPGFTQAKIDQLEADLGSYSGVKIRQSAALKAGKTGRQSFVDSCAQVARRRRKLQLAIDAERPYTNPMNAPLRTRLGLPADKGLS